MLKAYSFFMDQLPLIGAVGSILVVVGGIAMRLSQCHNFVCDWQAVHPTAQESASLALAVAVIKSHFNNQTNAAAIEAQKPQP